MIILKLYTNFPLRVNSTFLVYNITAEVIRNSPFLGRCLFQTPLNKEGLTENKKRKDNWKPHWRNLVISFKVAETSDLPNTTTASPFVAKKPFVISLLKFKFVSW